MVSFETLHKIKNPLPEELNSIKKIHLFTIDCNG